MLEVCHFSEVSGVRRADTGPWLCCCAGACRSLPPPPCRQPREPPSSADTSGLTGGSRSLSNKLALVGGLDPGTLLPFSYSHTPQFLVMLV